MSDTQSSNKLTGLSWTVGIIFAVVIAIVVFDPGKVIWRDDSGASNTKTVWVCTNKQIPLNPTDWSIAGPGYPPPLGKYEVTYFKADPTLVDTITLIDPQDTTGCPQQ